MKKIIFSLLASLIISPLFTANLAQARSPMHPDTNLKQREIVNIEQENQYNPSTKVTVTYRALCGYSGAVLRDRVISNGRERVVGLKVLVKHDPSIDCSLEFPWPEFLTITKEFQSLVPTKYVADDFQDPQEPKALDLLKKCRGVSEQGNELRLEVLSDGLLQFGPTRIKIKESKNVDSLIKITGVSENLRFVGGGSANYSIYISTGNNTKVMIRENVSTFYTGSRIYNYTLSCEL